MFEVLTLGLAHFYVFVFLPPRFQRKKRVRRYSSSEGSTTTDGDTTSGSEGVTTDSSGGDDDDTDKGNTSTDLDQTLLSIKDKPQIPPPPKKAVSKSTSEHKRSRRYQLTTSMFKEYPLIKAYATGPKYPDRNPHKWYCRLCHKNYSLKTRGGGGIVRHFKSSRHFRRDQRYRESQKMPVYNRAAVVVTGEALDLERLHFMAISNVPILDSKRLLIGQRRIPVSGDDVGTNNILKSQLSLYSEFLTHNVPLTVLPGMWGRFGLVTDHSSLVSNYSWDDPQVFVSLFC